MLPPTSTCDESRAGAQEILDCMYDIALTTVRYCVYQCANPGSYYMLSFKDWTIYGYIDLLGNFIPSWVNPSLGNCHCPPPNFKTPCFAAQGPYLILPIISDQVNLPFSVQSFDIDDLFSPAPTAYGLCEYTRNFELPEGYVTPPMSQPYPECSDAPIETDCELTLYRIYREYPNPSEHGYNFESGPQVPLAYQQELTHCGDYAAAFSQLQYFIAECTQFGTWQVTVNNCQTPCVTWHDQVIFNRLYPCDSRYETSLLFLCTSTCRTQTCTCGCFYVDGSYVWMPISTVNDGCYCPCEGSCEGGSLEGKTAYFPQDDGILNTTTTTTTTLAPEICAAYSCTWRCTGHFIWELISDECPESCECESPSAICDPEVLCGTISTSCRSVTTTTTEEPSSGSSTTTTTTTTLIPPEPPGCSGYICRWFCTYEDGEFQWSLVASCPSGCECPEPSGTCDADAACSFVARYCQEPEESSGPSGICEYTCIDSEYQVSYQNCTDNYVCPEVSGPCSDGTTTTRSCVLPSATTTTTSTTSPPPEHANGYCFYQCVNNALIRISAHCISGSCAEIINTNCTTGSFYYLVCNEYGGLVPLSRADLAGQNLEPSVTERTTAAPEYVTPSERHVAIQAFLGSIWESTTTTYPPCVGDCLYIWNDLYHRWFLYGSTCNCICFPPSHTGSVGETAVGLCASGSESLPDWELPSGWDISSQSFPPFSTTTTTTPSGYPNGYCKYFCGFGGWALVESTCISGYACADVFILDPGCTTGDYMFRDCTSSGASSESHRGLF